MTSRSRASNKKPRLLVLTHTFLPTTGGAEIGIHEIARRLGALDVTVATAYPPTRKSGSLKVQDGPYKVISYRNRFIYSGNRIARGFSLFGFPEIVMLVRQHRRQPIDVLNLHFMYPLGIVVPFARWILRIPVVLSLVGRVDVMHELSPMRRLHATIALRSATRVVQNSKYYLQNSGWADDAITIPYGASLTYRTRKDASVRQTGADPVMLVALQRLAKVKRVDVLVDVSLELDSRGFSHRLVIIGTGPEEEYLRRYAEESRARSIQFVGFLSEDATAMELERAHIFVSHSMHETFGVTLVEAMMAGLPIVAADTSCVSLTVHDGNNGLLVRAFDILGFADAIVSICQDPLLYADISDRNLRTAESMYTWSAVAAQFESVFLDVVRHGVAIRRGQ